MGAGNSTLSPNKNPQPPNTTRAKPEKTHSNIPKSSRENVTFFNKFDIIDVKTRIENYKNQKSSSEFPQVFYPPDISSSESCTVPNEKVYDTRFEWRTTTKEISRREGKPDVVMTCAFTSIDKDRNLLQYFKNILTKHILSTEEVYINTPKVLCEAFEKTQNEWTKDYNTPNNLILCTVCISIKEKIYTAWVGHGRAVLFKDNGRQIIELTKYEEYNENDALGSVENHHSTAPYLSIYDQVDSPSCLVIGDKYFWGGLSPIQVRNMIFKVRPDEEGYEFEEEPDAIYPFYNNSDIGLAATLCSASIMSGKSNEEDIACVCLKYGMTPLLDLVDEKYCYRKLRDQAIFMTQNFENIESLKKCAAKFNDQIKDPKLKIHFKQRMLKVLGNVFNVDIDNPKIEEYAIMSGINLAFDGFRYRNLPEMPFYAYQMTNNKQYRLKMLVEDLVEESVTESRKAIGFNSGTIHALPRRFEANRKILKEIQEINGNIWLTINSKIFNFKEKLVKKGIAKEGPGLSAKFVHATKTLRGLLIEKHFEEFKYTNLKIFRDIEYYKRLGEEVLDPSGTPDNPAKDQVEQKINELKTSLSENGYDPVHIMNKAYQDAQNINLDNEGDTYTNIVKDYFL